jgi:hypothetical protein
MPRHLEPDEVLEEIQNGFSPLEWRVELIGQRLGFSAFDIDGNVVLLPSSWHGRWARKPDSLRYRINVLRRRVEEEGYTLDPWKVSAYSRPSLSAVEQRYQLRAPVRERFASGEKATATYGGCFLSRVRPPLRASVEAGSAHARHRTDRLPCG